MGGFATAIELVLVVLLSATLVYAIRLYRAIGVLRQDRNSLETAVAGFDSGARQAEAGLERLREAAQTLGGQLSKAVALKDDLSFLSERGEQLADRLDALVRAGRAREAAFAPHPVAAQMSSPFSSLPPPAPPPAPTSAPTLAPTSAPTSARSPSPVRAMAVPAASEVRSQAERDLLLALRGQR